MWKPARDVVADTDVSLDLAFARLCLSPSLAIKGQKKGPIKNLAWLTAESSTLMISPPLRHVNTNIADPHRDFGVNGGTKTKKNE